MKWPMSLRAWQRELWVVTECYLCYGCTQSPDLGLRSHSFTSNRQAQIAHSAELPNLIRPSYFSEKMAYTYTQHADMWNMDMHTQIQHTCHPAHTHTHSTRIHLSHAMSMSLGTQIANQQVDHCAFSFPHRYLEPYDMHCTSLGHRSVRT